MTSLATSFGPQPIPMTPVLTNVRKTFGVISTTVTNSPSATPMIGISVMAQEFTDKVWLCVNEVLLRQNGASDSVGSTFLQQEEDHKMRPGTIIVGSPSSNGGGGAGGGDGGAFSSTPDSLEVVMGDRDDPLTNILSIHMYNLLSEVHPTKGMCLCISTRRLMKALTTPAARKGAVDTIMGLVVNALGLEC